jgi:hypothetical protein
VLPGGGVLPGDGVLPCCGLACAIEESAGTAGSGVGLPTRGVSDLRSAESAADPVGFAGEPGTADALPLRVAPDGSPGRGVSPRPTARLVGFSTSTCPTDKR